MTTQESKLVEYLKEQTVVMNNTILVDRDIVEKSLTYFLGNGITILSLSFVWTWTWTWMDNKGAALCVSVRVRVRGIMHARAHAGACMIF